jgi:hypothetical protein
VELSSGLLHIFVYSRIAYFNFKRSSLVGPDTHPNFLKNLTLKDLDKQSLTNYCLNMMNVLIMASGVVLISVVSLKSCLDFSSYPNVLLVYYTYLISTNFFVALVLIIYYTRNRQVRETLAAELKDLIQKYF